MLCYTEKLYSKRKVLIHSSTLAEVCSPLSYGGLHADARLAIHLTSPFHLRVTELGSRKLDSKTGPWTDKFMTMHLIESPNCPHSKI